MNLQIALMLSAKKHGYKDYLHAQKMSNNPWWIIDEVILGDTPVAESLGSIDGASNRILSEAEKNPSKEVPENG